MVDIKLSQLSSITSLNPADLLAVSKSLGGTNWESKSITAANVLKSIGESARTIKVAKDGTRDSDTIKDAVALALALSPTQVNPVAIQVYPGSYAEDNPINIPEWVSIYSIGGFYSTIIVATKPGNIFIGNGNSTISHFTIVGVPALSNIAYQSTTMTTGVINYCVLINCLTGVLADNGSINTSFIIGLSLGGSFDKLISVVNSGYILATSCISTGGTVGFCCSDTGSELYLYSCSAESCINGVCADNNGHINAFSNRYNECENGMAILATGSSEIYAIGCIIEDSSAYDVQVLSPTSIFVFSGAFNAYARQIVSGATIIINADDVGSHGAKLTGESSVEGAFAIGYPGATFEEKDIILNVGDGRSYNVDQYGDTVAEYWSWNNATSSFLPYTTYAGTQLIGDDDALIVASKFAFPAIRLEVVTAAVVGTGEIIVEYWNGSNWVATTMAVYDRETMDREKNKPFAHIGDHYVEISQLVLENVDTVGGWNSAYDVAGEIPAWTLGYPLYALRFRNDGALTTGMTFRNGKIRGNGWQSSTASARVIRWGKFRLIKPYYIDAMTLDDDPTNPPDKIDLKMSANITYKDLLLFKTNTIAQTATCFIIPYDLDTSSPLQCSVDGVSMSSNVGSIASTIYVAKVDALSATVVGSLPETIYTQSTPVISGLVNAFSVITQDIDISDVGTNDLLLVSFKRNGTDLGDTYDGDYILGDMTFRYYSKFS
jgi:hypothetical protein